MIYIGDIYYCYYYEKTGNFVNEEKQSFSATKRRERQLVPRPLLPTLNPDEIQFISSQYQKFIKKSG
jgi:hypothetical protein